MFCFGYWYHVELAPASLTFSQIFRFVRRSPVASCLGSSLPGRKLSRLTPANVGTPCAFLTGREKCGLDAGIKLGSSGSYPRLRRSAALQASTDHRWPPPDSHCWL